MKRFRCGLIVGKFSPLHLGHELLIRRALDECTEVVVLSYSKPELPGCEARKRELWLKQRFPAARVLVLTEEALRAFGPRAKTWTLIPANEADPVAHRRFCDFLCSEILGVKIDAVYSSETYGEEFARELTHCARERGEATREVAAVTVDLARTTVPISGTQLRADIHNLRSWVAPEVYASFVRRVCLLGGESSGKSTLAIALAKRLKTKYAAEYGRELWEEKRGDLNYDDLLIIAQKQIAREERFAGLANRYLFCDTSPLTTLFYCVDLFSRATIELYRLASRPYDLVLLCAPDFPFVQDGTRRDDAFRQRQHEWYVAELKRREIPYLIATGPLSERIEKVVTALTA